MKENGCEKENLKNELRTLCSHVDTFFKTSSASRCWPKLFQLRDSLNITNILPSYALQFHFLMQNVREFSPFYGKAFSKPQHIRTVITTTL